jgi:choline dehydrogenase
MNRPRVVVVGGGSAGLMCAAGIVEHADLTVVEAGIDPGDPLPDRFSTSPLPMGNDIDWGYHDAKCDQPMPAGRVLGGTSTINLCGALRGSVKVFDTWPEGWRWEDVLPHFCAIEQDLDFGEADWHGDVGFIPITRRAPTELDNAFIRACTNAGQPFVEDHNKPGAYGVGMCPLNWTDRRFGSLAVAAPHIRGRATILSQTLAEGLTCTNGRVAGVRLRRGSTVEEIAADHVVVSCGTIGSPLLLQRSGLGNEHVGLHLRNHAGAVIALQANIEMPAASVNPFGALLRCTLPDRDAVVQIHPFHFDFPGLPPISLVASLMTACSEGLVELRDGQPYVELREITTEYDRLSVRAMMAQVAVIIDELHAGSAIRAEPSWWGGDDVVEQVAQRMTPYFHVVGTCGIGQAVDERLAVLGVDGLTVADASVMPTQLDANTNLATMMIGHRAAQFVRESLV